MCLEIRGEGVDNPQLDLRFGGQGALRLGEKNAQCVEE